MLSVGVAQLYVNTSLQMTEMVMKNAEALTEVRVLGRGLLRRQCTLDCVLVIPTIDLMI